MFFLVGGSVLPNDRLHKIIYTPVAYALIALYAAVYVSVFRHLGVTDNVIVHELFDTALWIGFAGVAASAWLWNERRLRECYTILCIIVAVLYGVLISFGDLAAAVLLVSAFLLVRLVFQYVRRQR